MKQHDHLRICGPEVRSLDCQSGEYPVQCVHLPERVRPAHNKSPRGPRHAMRRAACPNGVQQAWRAPEQPRGLTGAELDKREVLFLVDVHINNRIACAHSETKGWHWLAEVVHLCACYPNCGSVKSSEVTAALTRSRDVWDPARPDWRDAW